MNIKDVVMHFIHTNTHTALVWFEWRNICSNFLRLFTLWFWAKIGQIMILTKYDNLCNAL